MERLGIFGMYKETTMKYFFLILFLSLNAFGKTAYDAYRMPASGNIPGWGTLFRQSLPSVGQQISSSCGSGYSNATNVPTDVTNLSVTITTTGRPVILGLIADGDVANDAQILFSNGASGTTANGSILFLRGATIISRNGTQVGVSGGTTESIVYPPGSFYMVDVPGAGTYTYKVQAQTNGGLTQNVAVNYVKFFAFEL